MAEESKIRVGLVGVGNWARYGHIPALKLLPEYDIVAVSSRSLEKAEEIGRTFDIPRRYGDMQQLIDDAEVDLVAVLSPAPEHASRLKLPFWRERMCIASGRSRPTRRTRKSSCSSRSSAGFGILWGFSGLLEPVPFIFTNFFQKGTSVNSVPFVCTSAWQVLGRYDRHRSTGQFQQRTSPMCSPSMVVTSWTCCFMR